MFSHEYCQIFKNNYSEQHLRTDACELKWCRARDFISITNSSDHDGVSKTNLSHATKAAIYRCSIKKLFLKISQNPQKNAGNFIKKRLLHRRFPVNTAKLLRTICL